MKCERCGKPMRQVVMGLAGPIIQDWYAGPGGQVRRVAEIDEDCCEDCGEDIIKAFEDDAT